MFVTRVLLLMVLVFHFGSPRKEGLRCKQILTDCLNSLTWPGNLEELNSKCSQKMTDYINSCKSSFSEAGCADFAKRRANRIFSNWDSFCQFSNKQTLTENFGCLQTNNEIIQQNQNECQNFLNSRKMKEYRKCMLQPMKNCCPLVCSLHELYVTYIVAARAYTMVGKDLPITYDVCQTVPAHSCA